MVKTFGLTHIALTVRDPDRSLVFYNRVFGVEEYYRDADSVQVKTPGAHDVIAFQRGDTPAGQSGGILHFGFRLTSPDDIDAAVSEVKKAGGEIIEQGEFAPGYPYAFVRDPDGYEVEIWFE